MRVFLIIYLIVSLVSQIVLIWTKILGIIKWSWYWVLSPVEIFAAFCFFIFVVGAWLLKEDSEDHLYDEY